MICKHKKRKIRIQENEHNYPFSFKFEECLKCGEMISPSVALRNKKKKSLTNVEFDIETFINKGGLI